VARVIVLDSGPLGLAALPPGPPAADACHAWLLGLEAAGAEVVVPAVADYEVRRELLRLGAAARLRNLDGLRARFDYLPVSEAAWDRAAAFWALLRGAGAPTAGPQDLDADAILAGQAATAGQPGDVVTVATTNVRHLGRFPGVDARPWATIT
jgi:predicted nucleic acid-binding protein